ncbi:MAG: radical SAM protein [Anaerolineae bacterium]|nr:radical SAM protein [Anaerolineae bacterium]MDW8102742.1 radical SAM protein [Anaerolineae bacterium]
MVPVPLYPFFRAVGKPQLLPFSLVISLTYRCNSRCSTCRVWERSAEELSEEEWEEFFRRLAPARLYYLTFSGGEPFLRKDLARIVVKAAEILRPALITIPTNGLLSRSIPEEVKRMLDKMPSGTKLGINLSLDGVGEEHDRIRNVPGNWERAMETYRALRGIRHPALILTIHTVISRFNVDRMGEIASALMALNPDSYITEVAEEREELRTVGLPITPLPQEYRRAMEKLLEVTGAKQFQGIPRLTQAFRHEYYRLTERILREKRQVIPCYAGWASGHIAPDGDVWTCCTRAEPVGNLRETGYDLRPIWFGERIESVRRSIKAGECYCPMANASYANMLLHPPTLLRVLARFILPPFS